MTGFEPDWLVDICSIRFPIYKNEMKSFSLIIISEFNANDVRDAVTSKPKSKFTFHSE